MGWIGVDFDGTLAHSRTCEPIAPMVDRVRRWLAEGKDVRIVTARASRPSGVWDVRDWCRTHLGQDLVVTNAKDYEMEVLYDDRAVGVVRDTGQLVDAGGEFGG